MTKVTVIPSTKNQHTQLPLNSHTLRRVAAYSRVSTLTDEQYTSYEAQVSYYKKFIQERNDWTYIDVYADEGLSGTSTKKRTQFTQMITDALEGKIDLIITKSISRFARNTLDTISFVRKLKDKGIEVYFEKENLWTLDPKSELILTIMASIAQEESRSISQNVTWGKRVSFQQGKVSFAYKNFLGYKKEDDKLVIDEDQAVIVRLIYQMFLVEGKTASGIANYLKSQHIKTPAGKTNWTKNTVNSILTNEKYKGDALLQKTYTENYLEHKVVKNNGQIPKYYVENNHPAIIDRDTWDQVQIEIERRENIGAHYSSTDIFASKLICGDCGGFYGKKKWHSNSKYSRFVHQCNRKFEKGKPKCQTPNLTEKDIKLKFIEAYNLTMKDKQRILNDADGIITALTDTAQIDNEIKSLSNELDVITELLRKLIKDNSKSNMSIEEYDRKFNELKARYERLECEQKELINKKDDEESRVLTIKKYLSDLIKSEDRMSKRNDLFLTMIVESATFFREERIIIKLHEGERANERLCDHIKI
ncbi:recombinase family protein [Acholeplasma laidlawii]|uniref:recombinase family protein n=1 Tax=Acholeplasma laidlawii TaxID=2148 RepID=UPI0021F7CDD9|nr:recombinase family protein [Acholeplasma laidlawii]